MPATGTYDFQFAVYDAGGQQQPQPSPITITRPGVNVANGLFTVQLDFGATAFPGADRYLEIAVKKPADSAFTVLTPRQQLASTPYAIRSANATNADNATNATNFTGNLGGDVTGTQSATVVSSINGQSATSVANGTQAANNAASSNSAGAIVKRDGSGNFAAGTVTANLSGNADSATTASSVSATGGDSVVTAINASSSTIDGARLPSTLATQNGSNTFSGPNTFTTTPTFGAGLSANSQRIKGVGVPTASDDAATKLYVDTAAAGAVLFAPSAQQITTSANDLINLKLTSNGVLGTPGVSALLSLSASGMYQGGNSYDGERFRVDNDGAILSIGEFDSGSAGAIPTEGAGTRFMWYPGKAAIRAGSVSGTQWDDGNTGLYSVAFGEDVRALGDNAVAMGKSSIAANGRSIAMGEGNSATGFASIALGYGASTSNSAGNPRSGSFVFSDFSVPLTYNGSSVDATTQFHAAVVNSFNVRAVGGSFFYTNTALTTGLTFNSTTATMTLTNSKLSMAADGSTSLTSNSSGTAGVQLSAGSGSWSTLSDRNMKTNLAAVNPREILRSVVALPISTWSYKTQDASVKHIGAMAQDFYAAFNVGEDDKHISTVDPDGVALAAIQGLDQELKDRDQKINDLQERLETQERQLTEQRRQLEALIKSAKQK